MPSILPFAPAGREFRKFRNRSSIEPTLVAFGPAALGGKLAKSIEDDGSGLDGYTARLASWYDHGDDRHHCVVVPLDQEDVALDLIPNGWVVMRCLRHFHCSKVVVGGSVAGKKSAEILSRAQAFLAAGNVQAGLDLIHDTYRKGG